MYVPERRTVTDVGSTCHAHVQGFDGNCMIGCFHAMVDKGAQYGSKPTDSRNG